MTGMVIMDGGIVTFVGEGRGASHFSSMKRESMGVDLNLAVESYMLSLFMEPK